MNPLALLALVAGVALLASGRRRNVTTKTVSDREGNVVAQREWELVQLGEVRQDAEPGTQWFAVYTPEKQFGPHGRAPVIVFEQDPIGNRQLFQVAPGFTTAIYKAAALDNHVNYPPGVDWEQWKYQN